MAELQATAYAVPISDYGKDIDLAMTGGCLRACGRVVGRVASMNAATATTTTTTSSGGGGSPLAWDGSPSLTCVWFVSRLLACIARGWIAIVASARRAKTARQREQLSRQLLASCMLNDTKHARAILQVRARAMTPPSLRPRSIDVARANVLRQQHQKWWAGWHGAASLYLPHWCCLVVCLVVCLLLSSRSLRSTLRRAVCWRQPPSM